MLDGKLYHVSPNAFEPTDVTGLLEDCPRLLVRPKRTKWRDIFPDDAVERIKAAQPDVVLRLGFRILHGPILNVARCGVWSLHHGDHRVNRGGPPGVWEIIEGVPTTGSILQVIGEELDGGAVLYQSLAPTDYSGSIARNRNNYYWKTAQFVPRVLSRLAAGGFPAFPPKEGTSYCPYSKRVYTAPRNRVVFGALCKLAVTKAVNLVLSRFTNEQWFVAFRMRTGPEDANNVFHRFRHLVPPKDRFWADPCAVRHEGRYYLFMEEARFATNKGVIVACEMRDDGSWSQPRVALECASHLSYPCVFRWKGIYYMVPESLSNRTIGLWRCVEFPYRWEFDSFIMEGVRAADSTILEHDGRLWLFACMAPEGAHPYDELFLFHAPDIHGPWTPHPRNPVVSDARHARPAGIPFRWGDSLLRPAQDCAARYGDRISIREITALTETDYQEREVAEVRPQWAKGLFASHTISIVDDLTVIDGCKLRSRW